MDDPHYFQLPVAEKENPVYRERVYCYELYHQLRNTLDVGFPYKLDGEVDKHGHPKIPGNKKPDLIIHVPGGMKDNLVVIEVKPATVRDGGLVYDLRKLRWLLCKGDYCRALMLVYGNCNTNRLETIKSRVRRSSMKCDGRILFVWHSGYGQEPRIFQWNRLMSNR